MGIILKPIDVVDDISKEEFFEKYLKPRRPVVIKNMAKNGLLTKNGRWNT
jgi:ribosomal protein L16 Arg81 hydroxylase